LGIAVGSIIGALLVIYNSLPAFGIHVTPVPTDAGSGIITLAGFLVGLFTKPPVPKDPAKTAAALAEAEANHRKALAAYQKAGGIVPQDGSK
jgi:hypothetical protein